MNRRGFALRVVAAVLGWLGWKTTESVATPLVCKEGDLFSASFTLRSESLLSYEEAKRFCEGLIGKKQPFGNMWFTPEKMVEGMWSEFCDKSKQKRWEIRVKYKGSYSPMTDEDFIRIAVQQRQQWIAEGQKCID